MLRIGKYSHKGLLEFNLSTKMTLLRSSRVKGALDVSQARVVLKWMPVSINCSAQQSSRMFQSYGYLVSIRLAIQV